jgi:hypothetical protein
MLPPVQIILFTQFMSLQPKSVAFKIYEKRDPNAITHEKAFTFQNPKFATMHFPLGI